jgi:ABC-type branched-subunit amino acid transport system substrate-binding protein
MKHSWAFKVAVIILSLNMLSCAASAGQVSAGGRVDSGAVQEPPETAGVEIAMSEAPLVSEKITNFITGSERRAVGVLLPLSGKREPVGRMILTGIEYASRVFSSNPSPEVEYLIRDYGEDDQSIPAIIEQLDAKEHVIALIGPLGETAGNLACREAQKRGIPAIMFSRTEELPDRDSFCFSNLVSADIQADALLRTAADMNIRRFAVLSPADNFGKTFALSLTRRAGAYGIEVVLKREYAPDTRDMKDTVLKLISAIRKARAGRPGGSAAAGPAVQALLIPDTATKAAMIASYMQFYRLKGVRLFGPNLWDTDAQKLIKIGGTAVENAVFVSGFYADAQAENVRDFNSGFLETFGYTPPYGRRPRTTAQP